MPKSKVIVPNVVRGGIAIPLKNMTNYYYMLGRSHENGGIDIGKDVEVQGGELVQTTKDAIKVFSDEPFSDPPFNGKSSSRRVLGGENPNKVFNQQEEFKKRHRLNDDGTQKRMGGPIRNRKQYVTKRDNTYVAPRFIKEEQTGRLYTTKLTDNEERQFQDWYSRVSKYKDLHPNPDAVGQDYDYRGYWKNEDREAIFDDKKGHFTDKYKQPTHPTFSNQSMYSNSTTPGGEWVEGKETWLFKHNNYTARQAQRTHDYLMDTGEGYILGTDTIIPTSRKRMGGLSRSKDYGSKSKPYPSVKSKDFAGGNRSYPIPTKADAVDALRLAGLHGRSDVKAKVYSKYPELRRKAKAGGLYSVTVNGKTSLRRFPSTGERTKAALGTTINTNGNNNVKHEDTQEFLNWYKKHPSAKFIEFNTLPDSWIYGLPVGERAPYNTPPPLKLKGEIKPLDISKYGIDQWGVRRINPFPNYPNQPVKPFKRFINNTGNYLKNNPGEVNDLIGLTSNITGGLLSHRINRKMLNRLQYIAPPTPRSAVKLKTHININPQLDRMRESLANYERTINDNTTSSNVALARRNQARLANTMQANELYGNRENAETQLINQDRTNQQNIANENIADYNKWLEGLNAFRNSIIDKKSENNISLVENINSGIQDLINRREKRRSDNQTIAAMTLANPDLPVEMLYAQGLINKSLYDRYMKAYRNRNNKTTTQQG